MARGKWSKLKDSIPRLQSEDASWGTAIKAFTQDLIERYGRTPNLGELGEEFNKRRAEKDRLNDELSTVNTELEGISRLLLQAMEDAGLTSVKLQDGSTLSVKDEPYSKVVDKAEYTKWLREQQMEELLSVNFMTTNSLVKDRLENGLEIPPGVEVWMKASITRRRG